ncbi:MAG: hypothetical protein HRT89_21430 [Lentisphaeria bacterium]|nr:hypothetical protein [Lentisphaeria bacterium]NQZ70624.1 hypothetical protein [Lentisphaeria bacterium]
MNKMENDYRPIENAAGKTSVEMANAQKYIFDLNGWIFLPGLIAVER